MEPADALPLVIFCLGAFLMPLAAGRLRIPAAVGEILFGLAVGASGLGLVHPTPFTSFLSNLGFIFLMFLVGMEIDFNRIEKEGRTSLILAAAIAGSTLGAAILVAWRLNWPFFLALVLGAMSVGILLVTTVESGVSRTRLGQMLLLVGSIGEFLTLLSLTAYNLAHRFGVGLQLVEEILKVVFLFAAAYAILSLLRLAVWWFPHQFQRWVHAEDPSEVGVRAGLVLMLSLAGLAGLVGLEPILGAFLAGALFSFVFREKGVLETKLSAVGQGFFIPLFFINVGASFDSASLGDLVSVAGTLAALASASLLVKLVPALLLIRLGFNLRQVTAGAFLLAAPLTLLVAAASIGREMGVLDPAMNSAIILLAIFSAIAFPTCFKALVQPAALTRASPPLL